MQFNANKRNLFRARKKVATNNLLPWITDSENFINNCTQCGNCITACPEKIIVVGDGGFPNIDFRQGECTFCKKCVINCEQDLFVDCDTQVAWQKKALVSEQCVALSGVYCRSCAESCEAQALTFKLGISAVPQIENELCSGCGACVSPCPTQAIEIKEL